MSDEKKEKVEKKRGKVEKETRLSGHFLKLTVLRVRGVIILGY